MSAERGRTHTILALVALTVVGVALVALVGVSQPVSGVQSSDVSLVNSTAPGGETDHAWTIQTNTSAPDRQLTSIELNYSGTGVGINGANLSSSSVDVFIGGLFTELESVTASDGVVNITFFGPQAVTAGDSITVTTNSTDAAFTNPSTVGNYQATVELVGDSFDPSTAAFTVGTGFEGTVTDDTGSPLQNVTVTVLETGATTQTDPGGNYALSVPAGSNYTLRFQKANYIRTDVLGLSLSQNQVQGIDQELPGSLTVTQLNLSDQSPNATGVEYTADFSVDAPVTNVSYVSVNLTDAAPLGLSTAGLTSNNLTVSVNGTEVGTTLFSTPGEPTVVLNLSTTQNLDRTEQLTVSVANLTNPDATASPYLLGIGLHADDGTGAPNVAKTIGGAQFEVGAVTSRVRDLTIPTQERTILTETPRHTNTFDTGAANVQSLAAGPATQTLQVTLDASAAAGEEQLTFDLNDTASIGLDTSLVGVTAQASELTIVGSTLDAANETLTVNYSASADVTNATIAVDIELSAADRLVAGSVATHVVTGPDGFVASAPYRAERDGTTGVAYSDTTAETFLGTTTAIEPTRDGSGGAFRIWQNQTITVQQSGVDQNVTVYTAQKDGAGAWQLGAELQQLDTAPGAISGYRSALPAGEYFVTFEGSNDAVYLLVEPLNLTATASPSPAVPTDEVTVAVGTEDAGGDAVITIVDQSNTTVYSQQTTLDASGNASLTVVPETDLNGPGKYAAVVLHNGSELRTVAEFTVEPRTTGRLNWTFQTGDSVVSSPAYANGVVFVGSDDGNVYAIDSTTGTELWSFQTGDSVASSPTVRNGVVYVGSDTGDVYALDATDGTPIWQHSLQLSVRATPTVKNGVVYVGDTAGTLYALNTTDGTERWQFQTGEPISSAATVDSGTVFFGNENGTLYTLDAATGTLVWEFQTNGAIVRNKPAVDGSTVYVGSYDASLYAVDRSTGEQVWRFQADDQITTAPVLESGTLYAAAGSTLHAVDTATGNEEWNYSTGSPIFGPPSFQSNVQTKLRSDSGAVAASGTLYFGSNSGEIHAVDASNGEEVWTYETGGQVRSGPAIAGTTVFAGSADGAVYALDASAVTGTVNVVQPVTEGQTTVSVEYEFGNTANNDAYLVVENLDTETAVSQVVDSDGTVQVDVTNLGGIQPGDSIQVTLYESSSRSKQLASDTAVVQSSGVPFFEVEIQSAPQQVLEGDAITVETAVTNTGDTAGTQSIQFQVRGESGNVLFEDQQDIQLGVGESQTVSFQYGTQSSEDLTVRVASENTTDSTTVTVESRSQPAITVSDGSLSFGEVPLGESVSRELTITNDGSAPLQLRTLSVVEGAASFEVQGGGSVLEAGASTTVTVSFAPQETGAQTGRLVVRSNDPDEPVVTVELAGTGVEGDLSVSPSTIQFGEVSTDQTATETITLSNDGTAPVTVTSIAVTSGDAAAFSASAGGLTLDSGQTRDVQLSFAPPEVGSFAATLLVRTQGGSTTTVSLSGTGVEQRLEVTPESLDFGDVTVEETATRSITIRNPTETEVSISEVGLIDGDSGVFTVSVGSTTLGPEETTTAQVTFSPGARENVSGTLGVFGPDGDLQGSVGLSGRGTAGELRVTPTTLQFGETTVGDTVTQTVTVENVGEEAITVSEITLTGDAAFDKQGASGPIRLGPGASRTVTVSFTPAAEQAYSGHLRVTSDAEVAPTQLVSLTSGNIKTESDATGQNQTRTEITIANATAGESVSVSVPTADDGQSFQMDNMTITPATDGDIRLNVTSGTASLATTPDGSFPADNTTQLGNLSVEASVDNDAIESVTFTYRVDVAELRARGTSPEDVALYRYDEERGVWVEKDTELLAVRDGAAILQTTGDGFSDWTAAAKRPELGITDTEIDIRAATTEEEITIQVFVTNTGGADGGYEAQLITNGEVIDREDATVPANSTVIINFVRTFDQPNVYEIRVNDVPVGEVEITEDEEVEVSTPEPDEDPTSGETETAAGAGDGDDGGGLDGFGPGFGVPVGVVAVVVTSYLVAHRRRANE